ARGRAGHRQDPAGRRGGGRAAALGEREQAARHADAALELCERWEIPLAARRLRDQRAAAGF
ncbi:hypothetical protein HII36_53150, partial [Nonomuraea sp. NN258]|uniref:hypothetical protein n=1 Tax=Nonomuraea antri TaxID=2730852 RepID=UPI0015687766